MLHPVPGAVFPTDSSWKAPIRPPRLNWSLCRQNLPFRAHLSAPPGAADCPLALYTQLICHFLLSAVSPTKASWQQTVSGLPTATALVVSRPSTQHSACHIVRTQQCLMNDAQTWDFFRNQQHHMHPQ